MESLLERKFKATVVWLILNGKVEEALEILAQKHGVTVPIIEVGLPKGRKTKALGCYNSNQRTISVLNSDTLKDPFVILHEFYHHLRTRGDGKHRGTEKFADTFAKEFIEAYRSMAIQETGND
jgi:Zn-dependent peptidase ImmA (M78 family)